MKKLSYVAAGLFLTALLTSSCRDERETNINEEVEVETLAPDVEDTDGDTGFDTNPVSGEDS